MAEAPPGNDFPGGTSAFRCIPLYSTQALGSEGLWDLEGIRFLVRYPVQGKITPIRVSTHLWN